MAGIGTQHSRSFSSDDELAHIGDAICRACYGVGRSRIEKRDIQGFREIVVSQFVCDDCGRTADEVQLAGQFGSQGLRLTLQVPQGCSTTLNRQVLKSDTATISIPEIEFEIGAGAYVPFAGDLVTVADVLMQACKNLNMNQAERRAADAETAGKIDVFIEELESYAEGLHAFTFVMEDHAGNIFIGGPEGGPANGDDSQLCVERYMRTVAQESRMGLAMPDDFLPEEGQGGKGQEAASAPGRLILRVDGEAEVATFLGSFAAAEGSGHQEEAAQAPAGVEAPASCAACGSAASSSFSAMVHHPVPGFIRGCMIVSWRCTYCGTAAAEVRSTGGISAQGARIRVRVEAPADLQRTVLQSASASLAVPELDLALSTGSGTGIVTTVGQLISSLAQHVGPNPALAPSGGAAAAVEAEQANWWGFVADLRAFAAVERPWTLEITDPLDSSLVAAAPGTQGEQDGGATVVCYDRTPEENQHFGLPRGTGAAPIA